MNISIYLDEPLLKKLKRTASQRHVSVSRCIRDILERSTGPDVPTKPLKDLARPLGIRLGGDALEDTERFFE